MPEHPDYNLERFIDAQDAVHKQVLDELRAGRKSSHWMWFIFPQIEGLGVSDTARHYSIKSMDEARAYLAHPVLGARLRECVCLLVAVEGRSASEIFGYPDDLKFRSSLTLYTQRQPGTLTRGREAAQVTTKPTIFLGGQGLCSTAADYERFCRMMMNRGELDGARVLKPEIGQKYGLGGAVDGEGGYSWGGANGTQFWFDRKNNLFAIIMVQTQLYKAPTYGTFRALANGSAGIAGGRGVAAGGGGGGGAEASGSQFKQRDKNGDGKLGRE